MNVPDPIVQVYNDLIQNKNLFLIVKISLYVICLFFVMKIGETVGRTIYRLIH